LPRKWRMCIATGLVIFLALLKSAYSLPVAENFYAEVLEYANGSWTSRYLLVNDHTLSTSTVAEIFIVRTDPSSGLQPVSVLVDGAPYKPSGRTGALWFSYIVQLDGKPRSLTISFRRTSPIPALCGIVGIQSPSQLLPGENLTEPQLPGFMPAGYRVELLLSSWSDAYALFDKPFFVLNASSAKILGQELVAIDVIVPFPNVTVGRSFIKGGLWYLYIRPGMDGKVAFPPYDFRAVYVNHPGFKGRNDSLIPARPPHVAFYLTPQLSIAEDISQYTVRVAVALPETICNIKDYTYRIVPPQGSYVSEGAVLLGENTTLTIRFFSGGISIGDLVVYTPPPNLLVQPPIYTLRVKFTDSQGNPVNNTAFIVYSRGVPVYRGFTSTGYAEVCPLPSGSYDVVAYIGSTAIGRGRVSVSGDTSMALQTNTTTVRFQLVRQGAGEVLTTYTAVLRGAAVMRANSSRSGVAEFHGVPPGNYRLEVYWNGTLLASYDVAIDYSTADRVLAVQAYKLQLLVRNLLDQPAKGIQVVLVGRGLSKTGVTDEMGRVDFGYVPAGNYTLIVEQAAPQRLEVTQDTFRVVQIDEVAKIHGFPVTGRVLTLIIGTASILASILVALKAVKSFIRRGKGVVEV